MSVTLLAIPDADWPFLLGQKASVSFESTQREGGALYERGWGRILILHLFGGLASLRGHDMGSSEVSSSSKLRLISLPTS